MDYSSESSVTKDHADSYALIRISSLELAGVDSSLVLAQFQEVHKQALECRHPGAGELAGELATLAIIIMVTRGLQPASSCSQKLITIV